MHFTVTVLLLCLQLNKRILQQRISNPISAMIYNNSWLQYSGIIIDTPLASVSAVTERIFAGQLVMGMKSVAIGGDVFVFPCHSLSQ